MEPTSEIGHNLYFLQELKVFRKVVNLMVVMGKSSNQEKWIGYQLILTFIFVKKLKINF